MTAAGLMARIQTGRDPCANALAQRPDRATELEEAMKLD
jgi:hypothetical protein